MSDLEFEPAAEAPRPHRRLLFVLAALFGVALLSACEPTTPANLPKPAFNPACTKVWVGAPNTAWSATTAWSPQGVPTGADVACAAPGSSIRISGSSTVGNVLLDGALRIESTGRLDIEQHTVAGIRNLTLEGTLNNNGYLLLLGQPVLRGRFEGSATRLLMSDASATIPADLTVTGGALDITGGATWTGGQLRVCSGAEVINRYALAVTNLSAAVNTCGPGDAGRVVNAAGATLTAPASGSMVVNVPFDNDGVLSAPGGAVSIAAGTSPGEADEGDYLPTGQNISFTGGTRRFDADAQVGGPGGTIHLAGAVFTGDTRINHPIRWTAGQLAGPSSDSTIFAGVPVTIDGSPVSIGPNATVENRGTTMLTTALSLCDGSYFDNSGPMTMTTANAAVSKCSPGDQSTFANNWGLTVTATNNARVVIATQFDNYGDVENTTTGRLEIAGGSTPGEYDNGYYYPRGSEGISFTGGVREFDSTGEVGLPGGTIGLNGVTVTGSLFATGEIRWNSGVVDGDIVIDSDYGASLFATSSPVELGPFGYLDIMNTTDDATRPTLFTLATTLRMCGNSGIYNDYATVRLENASARIERCSPTDQASFANGGTLLARPSGGTPIVVDVAFDNYDVVQSVLGSNLELRQGNSIGGASFGDIGAYTGQGVVTFAGGTRKLSSYASLSGANRLTSGAFTGTPNISGTFDWTGGQLAGPGAVTTITGGTLNVSGSATIGAGARLVNKATINVNGTLNACAGGITIENTKTVNLTGTAVISGCGTTTSSFVNASGATLAAAPSGGNVEVGIPVTNTGTITVNSGAATQSLRVASFAQTGGTTTLQTTGSRLQPLSGPAVVSGGTLSGIGQLTGSLNLSGGTLVTGLGATVGNFTVTGNLTASTGSVIDAAVNPTGPVIGRVQVNGTAALAGTMRVRFSSTPGVLPVTYQVVAATGGRTGTFASLTTTGLSAGVPRLMAYTPTAANIVAG